MSIICHVEVSTKQFSFLAKSKCFAAEISSLPKVDFLSQIYDDACDCGFKMISHITGKEVIFSFDKEDKTADNEIAGWRFSIIPECVKKNPELVGLNVLIIND